MLFVYAFLWNFVIGGVTGVFLSDVPANYQLHGSLFVTAHFHYTLVGGGLMGFFAAFYYWFPKVSGKMLSEGLGKVSFWFIQIGFNIAFLAMLYVGLQGQPRRVADYSKIFATRELHLDDRRVHPGCRDAHIPGERHRESAERRARDRQPLGSEDPGVDHAHTRAARELRGVPCGDRRPVRLRRGALQRADSGTGPGRR